MRIRFWISILVLLSAQATNAQQISGGASTIVNGNVTGDCNAIGNQNTVQCGPKITHYQFTAQLGEQLLQKMPDKAKPIDYWSYGASADDQSVGEAVYQFLIKHGYTNVSKNHAFGTQSIPGAKSQPFTEWEDGQQYHVQVMPTIREEK
jgi:hypothetical protein